MLVQRLLVLVQLLGGLMMLQLLERLLTVLVLVLWRALAEHLRAWFDERG